MPMLSDVKLTSVRAGHNLIDKKADVIPKSKRAFGVP